MIRRPAPLAILSALALAAGCAEPGPYPSLAPRPAEKAYAEDAEERAPAAQPDDGALAAEIARLVEAGRAGDAEFRSARPATAAKVEPRSAPGSDGWIEAQQAVSRLEAARARTTAALADLDRLNVERSKAGTLSPGDSERLRSALAELQALAEAQSERTRQLENRLSPP